MGENKATMLICDPDFGHAWFLEYHYGKPEAEQFLKRRGWVQISPGRWKRKELIIGEDFEVHEEEPWTY